MEIEFDAYQLNDLTAKVIDLGGLFERAKRSALSSTAFWVKTDLGAYVSKGGENWEDLHPVTRKRRKKRGVAAIWGGARKKGTPLSWLAKFSRYRMDDDFAQVDFGKSRKGKPGTFDPELLSIVTRAEVGEKVKVTDKMRRFFGATRRKRPKHPVPGVHYFPLTKDIDYLVTPKRPIFGPVYRRLEPQIMPYFENKFWHAVNRYQTGVQKG